MNIIFAQPWLFALLLLPLLIYWMAPPHREVRQGIRAPFLRHVAAMLDVQPTQGAIVPRRVLAQIVFTVIAWIALVAAAARPQLIAAPIEKFVPTRDLLLAVDLSGSMDTADFVGEDGKPMQRLDAVKQVLDGFLSKREGDRVGLIFFGSAAFVQAPFTEDLDVCRTLLGEAKVRMAGPRTVLGDAVGLAISVFESSPVEKRVLILLTDGNDTSSAVPPMEAARIAKDRKIKIYTVAIGDPESAGEGKLDEVTLRGMAETTGGSMFRGMDQQELEEIYTELDQIETRKVEKQSHRPRLDLFAWPLGFFVLAILAYHLSLALSIRRRRLSHVG